MKIEGRKASLVVRRLLGESPMKDDPPDISRQAARSTVQSIFAAEFGEVTPRGQFSLRFKYGGSVWTVRQTSNAIRVVGGPVTFDVSGTSRENAAKVIIAAIKGLSQS
jgi:hypothetical protein